RREQMEHDDQLLKENATVCVLLASRVTVCVWAPSVSCTASIVYVPGGRPFSSNEPSLPVTAKNGCSTTPTNADIHLWTSHLNGTRTSAVLKTCVFLKPLDCCAMLNSPFFIGTA